MDGGKFRRRNKTWMKKLELFISRATDSLLDSPSSGVERDGSLSLFPEIWKKSRAALFCTHERVFACALAGAPPGLQPAGIRIVGPDHNLRAVWEIGLRLRDVILWVFQSAAREFAKLSDEETDLLA